MDPLSVIASTIALVQAISSTWGLIQHLRGLPEAFEEVHRCLPLVGDTLALVQNQLRGMDMDESSKTAIEPVLKDCQVKAAALNEVFEKVARARNGQSVVNTYRTTVLRLGKAHKVETLMKSLLASVDALSKNQLFRMAQLPDKLARLEEAITVLSSIKASIPDSYFEVTVTQTVAQGGAGRQSVKIGHADNVVREQHNYNAQTMHFVSQKADEELLHSQRTKILKTLQTSPYQTRKDRNPDRVPGTCEWFTSHALYQEWRTKAASTMLWVSADPGTGKSVLARYLVDYELSRVGAAPRTVCYFFFKDDFEDQKTAKSALSCILHQLLSQRKDLFTREVADRFEAGHGHQLGSLEDLWDILVMVLSQGQAEDEGTHPRQSMGEIICILDAFDECEDREQSRLAKALCRLYDGTCKPSLHVKFLVTSRPYGKIRKGFHPAMKDPDPPVIRLRGESDSEMDKITREIDVYIRAKVRDVGGRLQLARDEEELLLQELLRTPHRTYLWVHLTLDLIQSDVTIDKTGIRKATSRLPPSVDAAYERILSKSSDCAMARKLLYFIVAASRPLTLREMAVALALEQHGQTGKEPDTEPEERFHERARDLCGLFVMVVDSKLYLLHQTAREFLVQDAAVNNKTSSSSNRHSTQKLQWKSSLLPRDSHRVLFNVCVQYLLLAVFVTDPFDETRNLAQYLEKHGFLDYSAKNCAAHFLMAGFTKHDAGAIQLMLRACDTASSPRCPTWFAIYWKSVYGSFPKDCTALIIASYFGLAQVAKILLTRSDVEIDAIDGEHSRSALSWASERGSHETVRLLIRGRRTHVKKAIPLPLLSLFRRGSKVDEQDKFGRTPLSYAAWNGHAAVAKLLVKEGARADSEDDIGETPISYALAAGYKDVARNLLDGAPDDEVSTIRENLLLSAARYNYAAIVQPLLDQDVSVDLVDGDNRTPLSWAAIGGHEAIVRLLLENNAAVDSADFRGQTPLSLAAECGHEAIVRLLLEDKAAVDPVDTYGRTPLSLASENGHKGIVRLLLENSAAVDLVDMNGRTPLSWAAGYGREAIVRLLLENNADVALVDMDGRTPLSLASNKGHEAVVRLMSEDRAHDGS